MSFEDSIGLFLVMNGNANVDEIIDGWYIYVESTVDLHRYPCMTNCESLHE